MVFGATHSLFLSGAGRQKLVLTPGAAVQEILKPDLFAIQNGGARVSLITGTDRVSQVMDRKVRRVRSRVARVGPSFVDFPFDFPDNETPGSVFGLGQAAAAVVAAKEEAPGFIDVIKGIAQAGITIFKEIKQFRESEKEKEKKVAPPPPPPKIPTFPLIPRAPVAAVGISTATALLIGGVAVAGVVAIALLTRKK